MEGEGNVIRLLFTIGHQTAFIRCNFIMVSMCRVQIITLKNRFYVLSHFYATCCPA